MSNLNQTTSGRKPDAEKISALLDKILPFARAADTVATRLVGKVRALALFGIIAAVWLSYVCYEAFDLSLVALLPIAVTILIAPLALWRMHGMLASIPELGAIARVKYCQRC